MARNLPVIPLSLNTSANQLRIGVTSASLTSNIETVNIRACPRDWTMHRWKGGTLRLDGLLHVGTSGTFMASDLPTFLDSITLASGQNLYECRLIDVGTAPRSGTSHGLIGLGLTYTFLTYDSPSETLLYGTDGTSTYPVSVLSTWLPSKGARGYIETDAGRFDGFHLAGCSVKYNHDTYERPSFPTPLHVYSGSSMSVSGLADTPTLNMCVVDFEWIKHVVPKESGDAIAVQINNALLVSQTAQVVMLANTGVIMYDMEFRGSLVNAGIGSNQGEWYY